MSNNIDHLSNLPSIQETESVTFQPIIIKQEDLTSVSTISPSKVEASSITPEPQNPNLNSAALFSSEISFSDVQKMTTEKNSLLITNLLDKWLEDLKKIREEYEEKRKSPSYQYWQGQLSPLTTHSIEANLQIGEIERSSALVNGLIDSVEHYKHRVEAGQSQVDIPSIAAMFFAGAALSGGGQLITQLIQSVSDAARIAEGFGASMAAQVATSTKYDFHLELSYMMGLFVVTNQLARPESEQARAINKSVEPNQKDAESFTKDLLKSLNSGQFDRIASRFWTGKSEKGEPIAKERRGELTSHLKIMMLAMSLGLLAVTNPKLGWLNGQEFEDLVNGKVDLNQDSLEANVTKELANIRNQMNIEKPGSGDALIAALSNYFNKNPSNPANLADFNKFYAAVTPFRGPPSGEIPV